ncbi:flagellar motor switch protein FliG [uncultured Oscillibacter sp.]|uniref:flagellar motor switch protein FliG n=1 Tax=uncultured Oscillibacter sp. TaxID=876091 RepID=UPI0025F1D59C|nr:flagellar motor switch protein FliG [uncultured Oscillibacter sp.]
MSAKKRSAAAPAETAAAAVEAPPAPAPAAKAEPAKQQPSAAAKSRIAALTGPQKAAAVVVSLGADKASQLYKYMDPEDVETLTLEVARLGYLDSEMTEGVLTDFYEMCLTNKAITEGGLEYAKTVLEKAFGEQTAAQLLEKVEKSMKNRQFAFLDKADAKSLFSALQYERPQTVALVLSYVSPAKSASVVEQMDPAKQVKVVEYMAKMESPSPSTMKIIEAEMNRRFSTIVSSKNVKVGGVDFVASLMNNIDRTSEKSIFDGLSAYNQELADEIRKRMFVFEDLVGMDDRSVQRFLRDCDPKDIVLSLKATTEEVANKLLSNMSTRMAQNIKDDLEITTNVRMKDVEEAQQRIVDVIRKLEEQNEIIIIKGGKDDIIA